MSYLRYYTWNHPIFVLTTGYWWGRRSFCTPRFLIKQHMSYIFFIEHIATYSTDKFITPSDDMAHPVWAMSHPEHWRSYMYWKRQENISFRHGWMLPSSEVWRSRPHVKTQDNGIGKKLTHSQREFWYYFHDCSTRFLFTSTSSDISNIINHIHHQIKSATNIIYPCSWLIDFYFVTNKTTRWHKIL